MVEINNKANIDLDLGRIKKITEQFLADQNLNKFEVSLAFISDQEMEKINQTYRGATGPTDVLSFSSTEEEKEKENFLGEILLDWEQIKRQARELGKPKEEELIFILIHGLLHLLGYNDESKEEKENMLKLGQEIINRLNF